MIIKHYIEYAFVRITVFILQNIPFRAGLLILNGFTDLAFYVFRVRRKAAINNISTALGREKSAPEILEIAHKVYRNFGLAFLEIARSPKFSVKSLKEMTESHGLRHLDEALKQGRGALIVSGHIGNMEFLGQYLFACGYPLNFIVGEQRNRFVDRLFNRYRSLRGIKIIQRDFPLRKVLKALKENEIVTVVSDQDAGLGGIFVDFFGKKASTPQGAALFSLKTGAPIIFVCDILPDEKVNKHRVFAEPVTIQKTGDSEKDVYLYTQAFTAILENYVRKFPEQYFWLHRRWKTRPPR